MFTTLAFTTGRLFLEDTLPKNVATSLKSEKFLNFFFKQLKRNAPSRKTGEQLHPTYPYTSPCGKEKNFVKAADVPIVFHTLLNNELIYAASLRVSRIMILGLSGSQFYSSIP